jgi:serine/threonine protein kinase
MGAAIHLVVHPLPLWILTTAVSSPYDSNTCRVHERLGPISGETLDMQGMETVAERMADYFVSHHRRHARQRQDGAGRRCRRASKTVCNASMDDKRPAPRQDEGRGEFDRIAVRVYPPPFKADPGACPQSCRRTSVGVADDRLGLPSRILLAWSDAPVLLGEVDRCSLMLLSSATRLGPYESSRYWASAVWVKSTGPATRALNRDVALKVLPSEVASDPSRRQRFEMDARAVAALNHRILSRFTTSGQRTASLFRQRTRGRRIVAGREMGLRKALEVDAQIAAGLACVMKPGSSSRLEAGELFFEPRGRAKIVDFGLAKSFRSAAAQDTETLTVHTKRVR